MRPPEISGEELSTPGRQATSSASLRKVTQLAGIMGLSLLAQCGHEPPRSRTEHEVPAARRMVEYSTLDASPELLEQKRGELKAAIRSCASSCSATEAVSLAQVCGDKPLTPEKLSQAAATLNPELRRSVHSIAVILRDYPQLAPDVLTVLHEFLGELSMCDPRKLAGLLIPAEDPSLNDEWNITVTSREFLRLEEESGAYVPPQELASSRPDYVMLHGLTRISNTVENK